MSQYRSYGILNLLIAPPIIAAYAVLRICQLGIVTFENWCIFLVNNVDPNTLDDESRFHNYS
jgi:hypothetical protein